MLTFEYTARDSASGKKVTAEIQADSERAAAKMLAGQGMSPIKIVPKVEDDSFVSRFRNRVSSKDRVVFARQLATLINAGLPLTQSLRTVADQTQSKPLKVIIQQIISDVEGGRQLSESFAQYPKVFNGVFIALIAAGETSGTLDKALERIATQQEKDAEVISKVRGAMVYPIIVLVVIVGVIAFMMVTVMPQIEQLYRDLKQNLPFVTQAMVSIANFMVNFWWLVVIGIVAAVYFSRRYIETDAGRRSWDKFKLNVPLFSPLFRKLYMARFMRTGETLLSTGVQMLQVLQICSRAVNNKIVGESIMGAGEKVKGGKPLSVALKGREGVLPLVPQMIGIGEQSGAIDSMMDKAATFYENELDNEIKAISTIIEPALMVVLAIVAGLMVVAILLPVYGLIGSGAIR